MATKTKRRRPDPFSDHEAVGNVNLDAIHHAIKPLDKIANRMELKWGCERLPELVSPDTAARFGAAKAKLDTAIIEGNPQDVAKRAAVLIRGWNKMDEEAEAAGHEPLAPSIWCHTTQAGFKFAVAQGNADAIKAIKTDAKLDGVAVFSLDEIGHILQSETLKLVSDVKTSFPTAKVMNAKVDLDDEIPF